MPPHHMTDKKPAPGKAPGAAPNPAPRRTSQPRLKKIPALPAPSSAGSLPAASAAAAKSEQDARPTAPRGAGSRPAVAAAAAKSEQDARPTAPRGAGSRPAVAESPSPVTSEWPDPEAASSGGTASPDHKRKRRRRKGKGQPAQAHAGTGAIEEHLESDASDASDASDEFIPLPVTAPRPAPTPTAPPRQLGPRAKVDPESLARKAWKIFLAEVSEEGVALIGDQDARELARRCFRLAEIFIEEQSRRAPTAY